MAARSSSRRSTAESAGQAQQQQQQQQQTPARDVAAVSPAASGALLALDAHSSHSHSHSQSQQLLHEVPARVAAVLKLGPHELPVVKTAGREAVRLDAPEHFEADAITTARWLLGARLVRVLPDGRRLSGRIVECEAYLGVHDAAAHSFQAKRNAKNAVMYSRGGTAYVYQCHRYFCMNVLCGAENEPTGVLIRALEPDEGVEDMLAHRLLRTGALGPAPTELRVLSEAERTRLLAELCTGPGRMCMALGGMDRKLNGACLLEGAQLYLEHGLHVEEHRIAATGRVGVEYAKEWARAPLRFSVKDSKHVSKPWPWMSGGRRKTAAAPPGPA